MLIRTLRSPFYVFNILLLERGIESCYVEMLRERIKKEGDAMKKTFFTLIEMIVVIVIISILAAIVVPNISDFQKDGITSMVKSNIRILQTASDTYKLKTGEFPSFKQPTLEEPQLIDIDRLYPDYIKSKPDYEKVKNQLYWVDVFGQVWGATVESPYNIFKQGNSIEWRHKDNAVAYNLYLLQQNQVTGAVEKKVVKLSDTYEVKKQVDRIQLTTPNPNFLLSSIDEYGLESAPSGINNQPENDWFTPVFRKSGVFEFELTAKELMYWDSFSVLEEKPEGTDIQYTFAIQNDKGEYGEFVNDFYSLAPSKGIKVRVNMIAANGKLPILWDMNIYYHYAGIQMDQFDMVKAINIQDNKVINPSEPVYIEEHFSLPQGEYLSDIVITDSYVNPPKVSYSYKLLEQDNFAPILSLRDVPQGSTVRVEKEYTSGGGVYVAPTLVERTSEQPVQQSLEEKVLDPELQNPEWTTVNRMNFFAHAGDGEITHWIDVIADDVQPEGTRILYRYATSSGQSWSGEVDAISKVSDSRSLRISAYLQVKTNNVGKVQEPTINSIRVIHERGVIDLDTVKPTVAIVPIKSNNKNIDTFSDETTVQWSYEAFDPRGGKIIEAEWAGDKRVSYLIGNYEVKLRVRNEANYWSDWVTYKIIVKQEKPVAVIQGDTTYQVGDKLLLNSSASYDPDKDGIVNEEWRNKKESYDIEGQYTIELRVQDKEGNWSDWTSQVIKVEPKSYLTARIEGEHSSFTSYAHKVTGNSAASGGAFRDAGSYKISTTFTGTGVDIGYIDWAGTTSVKIDGKVVSSYTSKGDRLFKIHSIRNLSVGNHTLELETPLYTTLLDYIDVYNTSTTPNISGVSTIVSIKDTNAEVYGGNILLPHKYNMKINYTIDQQSYISISIKDEQGNTVRQLLSEEQKTGDRGKNAHHVIWDGKNSQGNVVPNGIYTVYVDALGLDRVNKSQKTTAIQVDSSTATSRLEAESASVTSYSRKVTSNSAASAGAFRDAGSYPLNATVVGTGIDIGYRDWYSPIKVKINGVYHSTIPTKGTATFQVYSIRNLPAGTKNIELQVDNGAALIDYFDAYQ